MFACLEQISAQPPARSLACVFVSLSETVCVRLQELEQELEAQLSHLEKENVELKRNLQKAQTERDVYAEKLAFGTNELKDQVRIGFILLLFAA